MHPSPFKRATVAVRYPHCLGVRSPDSLAQVAENRGSTVLFATQRGHRIPSAICRENLRAHVLVFRSLR